MALASTALKRKAAALAPIQWELVINNPGFDTRYDPDYGGDDVIENFIVTIREDVGLKEWEAKIAQDPWAWRQEKMVFACGLSDEPSCCGFPLLSGFEACTVDVKPYLDDISKAFIKWFSRKGTDLTTKGYMCAYVPDQKTYDTVREVLKASGFVQGVQLKSNHGTYTNTRWEWFDKKKVDVPVYK